MINQIEFTRYMLLDAADDSLEFALSHERGKLWEIYGDLEHHEITPDTMLVTTEANTAELLLVTWNRNILYRVSEGVLDSLDTDWRNTVSAVPRNYLWHGDLPNQVLRLYPPPALAGRLQIIRQRIPLEGVALWHNALLALQMINYLALSDVQRARPQLAEAIKPLLETFTHVSRSGRVHYQRQ